jgi:multidrug transporter EmrE-like cation transporter
MTNKYLILILAAILSATSPILAKLYVDSNKNYLYIILAIILSTILLFLYINLLKKYDTTTMYTIVKILSILMVAIFCFVVIGDKLSIKKIIGILFGIVALILLTC